jgi:hypothetical protein
MTDRDRITLGRARTPGAEDYPPSTGGALMGKRPDSEPDYRCYNVAHESGKQTVMWTGGN